VSDTAFEEWAIVELMGHRRLGGKVTEAELFGTSMLRLDIYDTGSADPKITQLYGGSAVYCVTPTTEAIARKVGAESMPRPVSRYELERASRPEPGADDDDGYPF